MWGNICPTTGPKCLKELEMTYFSNSYLLFSVMKSFELLNSFIRNGMANVTEYGDYGNMFFISRFGICLSSMSYRSRTGESSSKNYKANQITQLTK